MTFYTMLYFENIPKCLQIADARSLD